MREVNYYHGSASTADSGVIGTNTNLVAVNINKGAASAVVTIYNGPSANNSVVAVIDASAKGTYWYGGARCPAGLEAVQSGGASDFTVSYI